MGAAAISEKGLFERIRIFSGLIILSVVTVVAAFIAIDSHYKAEAARQAIEKNRMDIVKHNAKVQKHNKAVDAQNARYLAEIDGNLGQIFDLRNDLEDIALDQKDPLKKELMSKLSEMREEVTQNADLLKKILASKKQELKPLPDLAAVDREMGFSMVGVAYADDSTEGALVPEKKFALYFAALVVTVILLLAIIIILFSKNDKKIHFGQQLIGGILTFACGAVFGGVTT